MTVDIIYYINLDHREDRKKEFINWVSESKFNGVVERIPAILKKNKGYIGCTMSHIKALETFLNSNYETCIIYEDDYQPIDIENYWDNIDKLSRENIKFDIILLSFNDYNLEIIDTKYDFLKKITFTYTTSGYIIRKQFANILLEAFKECLYLCLEEEKITNHNTERYCIDVYWMKLMKMYNFYCFYPRMGKQRESYSDVLDKIVDYKC
jgi:hypothetical protein